MTDKAEKILQQIEERDRKVLKHWKPYAGPPDWNFIVLDVARRSWKKGKMNDRS